MKNIIDLFDNEKKDLSPMINYFISLSDKKFLKVLRCFSEGVGYGDEYHMCTFSSDLDPWDEDYFESGIEFLDGTGESDITIIVDNDTFYKYLEIIANQYVKNYPDDKSEVEVLLKKTKQNIKK